MGKQTAIDTTARRLPVLIGAAALLVALVASLGGTASAKRTEAERLGNAKGKVRSSCPKDPCEAIGSVTGFQKQAAGRRGVFKMPYDGKVIAWSIDVSKPTDAQTDFFGTFYEHDKLGRDPYARLAVLRKKKKKFKLRGQSPKIDLDPHLGQRPIITLNRPLKAAKGDVIAVTVPTWAPIFDVGLSGRNAWVASRSKDKCSGVDNIKQSRAHQKLKSERRYGCTYTTARLVYWGYIHPNEPAEEPKKKKKGSS